MMDLVRATHHKKGVVAGPVSRPVGLAVRAVAAVLEGGAVPRDGRAVVRALVHKGGLDGLCSWKRGAFSLNHAQK